MPPTTRLFARRFCAQFAPLSKPSSPILRNLRSPASRRTYATGEKGPNPKPGQSPFKVWPFIAITLAGSGAYVLMVRSRAGMYYFPFGLGCNCSRYGLGLDFELELSSFESRFKGPKHDDCGNPSHYVFTNSSSRKTLPSSSSNLPISTSANKD
jgi:hypothetical protein